MDTLELLQILKNKYGILQDLSWFESLTKSAHSKNISVAEWNSLIWKTAIVSDNVDTLRDTLTELVKQYDSAWGTVVRRAEEAAVQAEKSASEAAQYAEEASNAEQFADEAEASAAEAKTYANTAESFYQKRTWNHIISTVEEFKEIETMTGAILVRGVEFTGAATGTYNLHKNVTQITFQDCSARTTLGNISLVAAEGSDTELIGFYLPVLDQDNVFRNFEFHNFRRVHDVRFNKRQNLMCYYNCSHISDCTVSVAHNCTYIENCRIFNDGIPDFLNCKAVCGIAPEPAHDNSHPASFTNCSFLMNIAMPSTYNNCTYVDETTCVGYVKAIDEGKVRVLNSTGALDAVSLVRRVSLDLDRANYLLNVNLSDANGALISTASVDLPLEEMIVNVAYIEAANTIVFYLRTGAEIEVPLKNIVASSDSIANIEQTVESEGDQGVNVWQLTTTGGAVYEFFVRNGSKGSPGYSPILGVDYWTPADKQEIYDYIDDNILGGEF